jgi:Flp pilus assembly pilin Flp
MMVGHCVAIARRFRRDMRGATAIEYAMIASCIGAAVAATVFTLGGTLNGLFMQVAALFP